MCLECLQFFKQSVAPGEVSPSSAQDRDFVLPPFFCLSCLLAFHSSWFCGVAALRSACTRSLASCIEHGIISFQWLPSRATPPNRKRGALFNRLHRRTQNSVKMSCSYIDVQKDGHEAIPAPIGVYCIYIYIHNLYSICIYTCCLICMYICIYVYTYIYIYVPKP